MHNFSTKDIHRSNRDNFVKADSSAFSLRCLSTFFECEMKVSFINIDSRLKKMEDYTDSIRSDSRLAVAQNCPMITAQKCPIYTLPTYTLPNKVVPTMYYHVKDRK